MILELFVRSTNALAVMGSKDLLATVHRLNMPFRLWAGRDSTVPFIERLFDNIVVHYIHVVIIDQC